MFTFVNAVLIRGLPFNDPDRILVVGTEDARGRNRGSSYRDFEDLRAATRTFAGLAAFSGQTMNVSEEGRAPERFQGPYLSANAFKLIGQAPLIGRDFLPDDDRPGAAAVVILGNGIWKNRYGSDPGVIGRSIKVNDVPSIVIGVMPEGFNYPAGVEVLAPLAITPELARSRQSHSYYVVGRLKPDIQLDSAQADLATIAADRGYILVSCHDCGRLTDDVIDKALAARAKLVVLPCCQSTAKCDLGGLAGWLDPALAIDVTRAVRLLAVVYFVHTQTIPAQIKPKNRLLLAEQL